MASGLVSFCTLYIRNRFLIVFFALRKEPSEGWLQLGDPQGRVFVPLQQRDSGDDEDMEKNSEDEEGQLEEQIERLQEKVESAQSEQKNLFLVIFQVRPVYRPSRAEVWTLMCFYSLSAQFQLLRYGLFNFSIFNESFQIETQRNPKREKCLPLKMQHERL